MLLSSAESFNPETSASSRIAFITFSHLANLDSFQYLIQPSIELWLPPEASYFVVLSQKWETEYRQLCDSLPPGFSASFCKRIQPIFVDCPDAQWGHSPCCKQEEGLMKMHATYGNMYDWFLYGDDDNYIRTPVLQAFLGQLDPTETLIATSGGLMSETASLGKTGYMKEEAPYNCSRTDENRMYPWGQPVIYSRAALQSIQHGLSLKGLTAECKAFDVTHDTGNAIFHYMHMLPEVRIGMAQRMFFSYDFMRWSGYDLVGFHGVKASNRSHHKLLNMQQVHDGYKTVNQTVPKAVYHRSTGFAATDVYRQFGDIATWTEWHTFEPKHCG